MPRILIMMTLVKQKKVKYLGSYMVIKKPWKCPLKYYLCVVYYVHVVVCRWKCRPID